MIRSDTEQGQMQYVSLHMHSLQAGICNTTQSQPSSSEVGLYIVAAQLGTLNPVETAMIIAAAVK